MYDLIVIGGGPVGLTATMYAIRKRLNVLLITKDMGGKTNYHLSLPWIADYQVIRGLEIINKFRSELEYLDFTHHMEAVEGVSKKDGNFIVTTKGGAGMEARSVIIATGTRRVRMDVPGEKEFTMKGLCHSALSYAPLFIDKTTIVIGDDELALAGELATVANHVYLACENKKIPETPLGIKLPIAKGDDFARKLFLKGPDGQVSEYQADGMFVEKALTPNSQMVTDLVN